MATNYGGYDLRGRVLDATTINQYLIGSAAYYKALDDFNIKNERVRNPRTGEFSNIVTGDVQGATNYLKSLGLIPAPDVLSGVGVTSSEDRNNWKRTYGQNLSQHGTFRFIAGDEGQPGGSYFYPNGSISFAAQIAQQIFNSNPELRNPTTMQAVLAQKPEVAVS